MTSFKDTQRADGVGFLYRSCFAVARGELDLGQEFLATAAKKLPPFFDKNIGALVKNRKMLLAENSLYWAEKILDEYKKQLLFLRGTA